MSKKPEDAIKPQPKDSQRSPEPETPSMKRPGSAYILFCNSKRASMVAKYPEAKNKEIIKMLAGIWNESSSEEKQPFIQEYEKKMEVYKLYVKEHGSEKNSKKKKAKKGAENGKRKV